MLSLMFLFSRINWQGNVLCIYHPVENFLSKTRDAVGVFAGKSKIIEFIRIVIEVEELVDFVIRVGAVLPGSTAYHLGVVHLAEDRAFGSLLFAV